MAISAASGTPQYSGTFVPTIWSTKFQVKFYAQTTLNKIANSDYKGEVKNQGDKVEIRTVPTITTGKYYKGATITNQRPEAANIQLEVSEARYFSFIVDNIDEYQTDMALMGKFSEDGSNNMKTDIETEVYADIYPDAHASNKGATAGAKTSAFNLGATGAPFVVSKVNVLDLIIDVGTVLTEQNVPEGDRWGLIPPFMSGMILKSDIKDASLSGDGQSTLRTGRIGMIDGNELYKTNLLTSVTDGSFTCWHPMFGHKSALCFVAQMTETDNLKAESTFGQIVRMLMAYGWKVIKPEALVDVYVRKG